MEDKDMLEETNEIEQGDHGVHPMILVLYGILVVTCIAYFFTHITRPV
jgi:hypothetical protein